MNKKTKSSIILTSLGAIAIAGSLIAGSTYALFTSESKTNIAVSSGTVKVTAVVKDLLTYTGEDLTGNPETDENNIKLSTDFGLENGQFKNGGTAEYDETSGTLTLDKMTPGDKVTFTINVTNESTVNVKYRTVLKTEEDNDLFAGLKVSIDGTSYDGTEVASPYTNLFVGSDPDDISVSIELPSDADDIYQNKTCKIVSTVEAIQGNAHVESTSVESKAELTEAIADEEPVSLSNEISFDNGEWINVSNDVTNLTIYGNGKALTANNDSVSGTDKGRVINVEKHSNDLTITLVDLDIVGPTCDEYNRGISLYKNTGKIKVVLDNCKVSANHYALNVAGGNSNVEIVAKNTTFEGYAAFQTWSANTKATFTNCTLRGVNQWGSGDNDFATIVVNSDATNSVLSFNKCTIEAIEAVETYGSDAAKELLLGDSSSTSTFTFTGCTFKRSNILEIKTLQQVKDNSFYNQEGTIITVE